MPDLQYAVFCAKALVDRESNNVSLIELIDEIGFLVPPPPVKDGEVVSIAFNAAVVAQWHRAPDERAQEHIARIVVVTAGGRRFPSTPLSIQIDKALRARTIFRWSHLPFDQLGQYWIEVEHQVSGDSWAVAHKIPVTVKVAESTGVADKKDKPTKQARHPKKSAKFHKVK